MAEKIQAFFTEWEKIWEAIPGYFKVFIYSVVSSVIGLYFSHTLSFDAVLAVLVTNLGLYTVPRAVNTQVQKLK